MTKHEGLDKLRARLGVGAVGEGPLPPPPLVNEQSREPQAPPSQPLTSTSRQPATASSAGDAGQASPPSRLDDDDDGEVVVSGVELLADADLVEAGSDQSFLPDRRPAPPPLEPSVPERALAPAMPAELLETGAAVHSGTIDISWEAERDFYVREAQAREAHQPERAGLLWLEAARAAELAGDQPDAYFLAALDAAPENLELVRLVRTTMYRLGRYDDALELAMRQLRLGGEGAHRSGAFIEASALARFHRHDIDQARELLQQALDSQPGQAVTLALCAGLLIEQGDAQAAAETLEQLSETLTDVQDRAMCLYTAGTIRESRLGQTDAAENDYARAAQHDPSNVPALLALVDLQETSGERQRLCDSLEQLAQVDLGDADKARCLQRAAVLRLNQSGDAEAAARNLSSASSLVPDSLQPLTRLAAIYEATGKPNELTDVLERTLARTLDAPGQAALLTRIGWNQHYQLGNSDAAIAAYQRALEVRPGHVSALHALEALYRQRGDFEQLLVLLQQQAEGTSPPLQREMYFVEAAGLLADQLDRADDAITLYLRAMEIAPGTSLAFWPLRRLLRQRERFAELAHVLSTQIAATSDESSRNHLLLELAQLQRGPLNLPDIAVETLAQARRGRESNGATVELIDLYMHSGRYPELVDLLLEVAEGCSDRGESQAYRMRAAMTLERYLSEPERALEVYRSILERDPANHAAKAATGRLYHRLGRWNELVELLQRDLVEPPTAGEAVELWCQVGELYEHKLGQPAAAMSAYKRALDHDPSAAVAVAALERLGLRHRDRLDDLIDVLQRFAENYREPLAAADALCRAGELAESTLDDPNHAEQLYSRAEQRLPRFLPALHGLVTAQQRQRSFAKAAQTLRQLMATTDEMDLTGQFALRLQLARLEELWLGQSPQMQLYELAESGTALAAYLRLERLRVARSLQSDTLAEALLQAGTETADPALATAYLLESAYRYEIAGDVSRQRDAAHLAFDRCPEEPTVCWILRRSLERSAKWADLGALLERDAKRQSDPGTRSQLLTDATSAYVHASRLDDALRLAHRCLADQPYHLPSLRLLAHLAELGQDWPMMAEWQNQLATVCADSQNRIEACLSAAAIWSRQVGNPQRALASLQPALGEDATQPAVFAQAEQLLLQMGDHTQLSDLYACRIRETEDSVQRIELLRLHARILRDKLKDGSRASAALSQLLSLAPHDLDALKERSELLEADGRWSDAADSLRVLIEHARDPAIKQAARMRLAHICFERLHHPKQARDALWQLLEADPTHLPAKRLLVQIALSEGQWEEAAQILEALAAGGDARIACWAMSRLAEVAQVGYRDTALRDQYQKEAIVIAGGDADALDEIVEHFRKRGHHQQLLGAISAVLRETSNAEAAFALRLVLAETLLLDFRKPEQAIEQLRESLMGQPDNLRANLLYAQALEQLDDAEAALEVYRRLLLQYDIGCGEAHAGVCRLATILGKPAVAAAAAAALELLGEATDAERAQIRNLDTAGHPRGKFDPCTLFIEPPLRPVQQLLQLLAPHLGPVYPTVLANEQDRGHAAAVAATQLANALGTSGLTLSAEGTLEARTALGRPVPLQVAPQLANRPATAAFRFWVGRALASAQTGAVVAEQLSDRELGELLEALSSASPVDPELQRLRKQVLRALPRKVRKQIEQLDLPTMSTELWAAYRTAEQQRADQAGLIASGDPAVVVAELARAEGAEANPIGSGRIVRLIRFAISDAYGTYHRMLWTAS